MERIQYNRIKEVLDEKNKDVYWLQNQLEGENIPCVVRWCKNVKQPTIEQLFEIARVLEVDVRELIVSTNSQLSPHNSASNIEKQRKSEIGGDAIVAKKEILSHFQGKDNVRHYVNNNGAESWLTQEICFGDETTAKGACKLNTVENETKHVLFLFNSNDEEVGRYYIGKRLQGKTPSELIEIKDDLVFFKSFNPESKTWIPCVGVNSIQLNMEDKKDIVGLSNAGLTVLYSRLELKKRKLAVEFCNNLLKEIDGWEKLYRNAKRCVERSPFYGYKIIESDLSEIEKIVFFWNVISVELQNRPREFCRTFPEQFHRYSEDNFRKLYDYVFHSKHWWNQPISGVGGPDYDAESTIMSALSSGEGDHFGF